MTPAANGAGTSESAGTALEQLDSLSEKQETEILDRILLGGYDQGTVLPIDESHLGLTSQEAAELLAAVEDREPLEPTETDPFETEPVPASDLTGSGPHHVVVSQRCDLIRCFRDEPLVEVARAEWVTDADKITRAKVNSPRHVYLCGGEGGAWIVDLRSRAHIPKPQLIDNDNVLPVSPGRPRRDLALRLGRRYSRDAIPENIVREFQDPFSKWIRDKNSRRRKAELFSEFLVQPQGDDTLLVLGLVGSDAAWREAQAAFGELIGAFDSKTSFTIAPESTAVRPKDISFGMWKTAHKLDLDRMSRGAKASPDAAEPTR